MGEERRQEEERPWWEALRERPGVRGTDGGEGPKGIGIGCGESPGRTNERRKRKQKRLDKRRAPERAHPFDENAH